MSNIILNSKHEENRKKICYFCLKKKSRMLDNKGKIKEKILEFFNTFDDNDNRRPNAICDTCRILLYRVEGYTEFKPPDYSTFKVNYTTRSKDDKKCDCDIFCICRKPGHKNFVKNAVKVKNSKKKCIKCKKGIVPFKTHFCHLRSIKIRTIS